VTGETFAKRWKARDMPPGEDGRWSTRQVCAIVFGDKEGERLRLTTEQADKVALENAEKRRELVHIDEILAGASRFIAAAKSRILASSMTDEEKDQVLQDLAGLASKKVADGQGG
jgi:phage terminase Nu1 subunit (DNA packaging protein)